MILRKPASETLRAVCKRIKATPDGELLKNYLKDNLDEADMACRVKSGEDLYRSQGNALTLKDILDLLV